MVFPGFWCWILKTHGFPQCFPRLLPTRECYGQALLHAERFEEAEDVFRQALEVDSFHAEPMPGRLKDILKSYPLVIGGRLFVDGFMDGLHLFYRWFMDINSIAVPVYL